MKHTTKSNIISLVVGLLGLIVLIAIIGSMSFISQSNRLIEADENVHQAQSKVETALQRRYDLIPNVVSSVKGYISHEEEIFTQIADARSKIGSSSKATQAQGQSELESAISRLLVIQENYPALKADKHVSELMAELEGSENRIFVARNDYNATATEYNKLIRRFPTSIVANMQGYKKVDLYVATDGAQDAPRVEFE